MAGELCELTIGEVAAEAGEEGEREIEERGETLGEPMAGELLCECVRGETGREVRQRDASGGESF